jgi:hypothetical protein
MRVVCLCVLVACTKPAHPNGAAPAASALPVASSAPPVVTSTAPVGLSNFSLAPTKAVAKNDRGVSLLAKGKAAEAVTELEGALAVAPDFVRVRYNLACAHARAGDFDKARSDLESVYDADFVGIRAHARADSDLADFWKSTQGKDLAARIPSWEGRFKTIIDRGVHAILWRDGAGNRGLWRPALLRVGVFDPDTARFVAVAPPSNDAISGFTASMAPYAVVATGSVRDMLGGDMDAGMSLNEILFYPISTAGTPTAKIAVGVEPYSGGLALGASGATYRVWQAAAPIDPPDKMGAIFDLKFGAAATRTTYAKLPELKLTRDRPVLMNIGYDHWGYVAQESDGAYTYSPGELTLPSGTKIPIPKALGFYRAPARVVPSPTGDRVVLVFNAAVFVCQPSDDIPGRFKMALVETSSGKVTPLGEGDGAGHAVFRANGDLYVQRGRRVFAISPSGETPLPDGVLLVPPLDRYDQCGF